MEISTTSREELVRHLLGDQASSSGVPHTIHPLFTDLQQLVAHTTPTVVIDRAEGGGDDEIGRLAQEGVHENVSNEVFSHYEHQEILPSCQPHPADIVEAGSLAHLSLPDPTYNLASALPTEIVTSGKLSGLQLQGVLYACQRHQTILPNNTRAGFFLGDGAGVGKGRQIAGIILDNFARKRTKHIWFSISSDLIVDARRDLADLGCHIKVIEGCQQLDKETKVFGLPSDFKEGVLFNTYATLVSSVQRGGPLGGAKTSRLQQLVNWCGGSEFDGCLVFDECHKAKNFVPGKEQASTKVALAVSNIQRILPKARVVYCSATGVTDVKNMAFMERLGLWGDGAPFKTFANFLESVHRKGLGVAEMLAMEMKMSGMYLSRGLSFKQTEFMTTEIHLTKSQVKMYDTATHVWNELRKSLESAISRTGCTNTRIWSAFWSTHQRFFKQLCLGIKVPAIVEEAEKALAENFCVVIGLQSTGEASLVSELSKNGEKLTGFVSLCREMLTRFIELNFPTQIETSRVTEEDPKHDQWSVTARNMLLDFVKKIPLPDSPLDEIIDKLGGPGQVAEMTGRRGRIVRHSPCDEPRYELRDCDKGVDRMNVHERNLFMEGTKYVAIISDAASTGISLHADTRVANQRRRVHITFELPWSADKAVQQLGRSHRSNQTSGPLYKLTTTNLGGERRFTAAVARRLQSLGALTKGDRRAATGADLSEFNFDTPYGRQALRMLYHGICHRTLVPGVVLSKVCPPQLAFVDFNKQMQDCLVLMGLLSHGDSYVSGATIQEKDAGDVGKFLNRILGLSVGKQNILFNYFCQSMEAAIETAKRDGRYNEGLVDIMGSSITLKREPRIILTEANKKATSATKLITLTVDRGMSWETAVARKSQHNNPKDGFYKSRREIRGKHLYLLATKKENSSHMFTVARPNTGLSLFDEEEGDLMSKYIHVSPEKACQGWNQQYELAKDHCIHGPKCKLGRDCSVGARCYTLSLLSGGVVTLLSVLETTIARFASKLQLTKHECNIRVVRAVLDSGERVVGIRYPEILLPHVERALQEQQVLESVEMKQMMFADGRVVTVPVQKPSNVSIQKVSVVETETPVCPRFLAKALTPPVTIKSFFKPSTKLPESTDNEVGSEKICGDKVTGLKENLSAKGNKLLKEADQSSCGASSLKRPFEKHCDRTAVKKQKQSNLFASFARQKAKEESVKEMKMTCPVCGKKFDAATRNSDVNKHIDNCLIE